MSLQKKDISNLKKKYIIIRDNIIRNNLSNTILSDILNKYNIKKTKTKHILETTLPIYKVHAGHVYNPPFFDYIIIEKKITFDDIKMAWNMILQGGTIIIPNKGLNNKNKIEIEIFKNNIVKNTKDYIHIKKPKNTFKVFQFPKYRILDFIIAGTMKGGTTAAITNFNKHPDISMVEKEIHYFDKKENYQKGVEWYKKHFNYNKKMVGDKAPDVMYQTSCLELLQIVNPHIKIILFLRNPIDRAYSHWKMSRDLFRNMRSFEDCIEDEIENRWNENRTYNVAFWYHFVQRGLYYQQIIEILKYFPKSNIHILITENVKNNMDKEYQSVFKFLDLPEYHNTFVEEFSSKSKDLIDTSSPIYKKLKKIYEPDVKLLEKFIGYKTGWW
jgi:hypothetical protein